MLYSIMQVLAAEGSTIGEVPRKASPGGKFWHPTGLLPSVQAMYDVGSSDSSLHAVELPRGRSFFWQIGVISSIQDLRQVDRGFYGVESVVRGNADSLLN